VPPSPVPGRQGVRLRYRLNDILLSRSSFDESDAIFFEADELEPDCHGELCLDFGTGPARD